MFRKSKMLLLPAIMLLSLIPLRASIIYDTFGSTPPGYTSPGWAIGKFAQFNTRLELAVPFTPAADYLLENITIAAQAYSASPYDQLTMYLAAGAAAPGPAIESFTFNFSGTSLLSAGSVAHPGLASGAQYWVVLTAPTQAATGTCTTTPFLHWKSPGRQLLNPQPGFCSVPG